MTFFPPQKINPFNFGDFSSSATVKQMSSLAKHVFCKVDCHGVFCRGLCPLKEEPFEFGALNMYHRYTL